MIKVHTQNLIGWRETVSEYAKHYNIVELGRESGVDRSQIDRWIQTGIQPKLGNLLSVLMVCESIYSKIGLTKDDHLSAIKKAAEGIKGKDIADSMGVDPSRVYGLLAGRIKFSHPYAIRFIDVCEKLSASNSAEQADQSIYNARQLNQHLKGIVC